ncbi:MAG: dockerin type I domain-containing protein [Terrimicrobiaceae bacterium]|nr:dockerin type I domain-containing protein [Terrimicrobiaceae bacterium]
MEFPAAYPKTHSLFVCLAMLWAAVPATYAADVYVSTTGSDSNPGTLAAPVATLHKARLLIAADLAGPGGKSRDWVVMFRGGTYFQTAIEAFSTTDTAGSGHTVIYTAYPGESATISGGQILTGFAVGGDGLWRLNVATAYPSLWNSGWRFGQIWVNENCVRWPIRPVPKNDWFRSGPAVAQSKLVSGYTGGGFGTPEPVEASQAGNRYETFARSNALPGYTAADGVSPTNTDRFSFNAGELNPAWTNYTDIRIEIGPGSDLIPLAFISGTVATLNSHLMKNLMPANNPWRRHNVFEDLGTNGQVGEMYLNRSTGLLTYVPRPGETPANSTVIAPVLGEKMILISNASRYTAISGLVGNLTFKNLTFSHTNSTALVKGVIDCGGGTFTDSYPAIEAIGAANILVDHCTFSHLGGSGVIFGPGSNHNTVQNCLFFDLGGAGLGACRDRRNIGSVQDDRADGQPNQDPQSPANSLGDPVGNTNFFNNTVHDFCKFYQQMPGIFIGRGANNQIVHNEAYFGTNWAMLLGAGDAGTTTGPGPNGEPAGIDPIYPVSNDYVAYNHIHDINSPTSPDSNFREDYGGLYIIGPLQGTIVEYNKVHDVYSSAFPSRLGAAGGTQVSLIYTDNGTGGAILRYNLAYGCRNRIRHANDNNWMSEYNNIYYNIFGVSSGAYGNQGHWPMLHYQSIIGVKSYDFHHNILMWGNGTATAEAPETSYTASTTDETFDYNTYYQIGATITNFSPTSTIAQWRAVGPSHDQNSGFNENPLFVDPAHGNFALQPGSPALARGFQDFSAQLAAVGTSGAVGPVGTGQAIFQEDFNDQISATGGSMLLNPNSSAVLTTSISGGSPMGSGNYLSATISNAATAQYPATFAPATISNSWEAMAQGTVNAGNNVNINGGFDILVRPNTIPAGDQLWFRPVDVDNRSNSGLRIILTGTGSTLQFQLSSQSGVNAFSSDGVNYNTNTSIVTSAFTLTPGAVSHVAFALSTDSTGKVTGKLFAVSGSGPIDTSSSTVGQGNLIGIMAFYVKASLVNPANAFASGAWTMAVRAATSSFSNNVDYDLVRLFSADPGAFTGMSQAPVLISAVSRKNQGGVNYDIPLPLTGAAAVECRYGPMVNGYQLILTFDQNIASGNAAVTGGAGAVSGTAINGATMTLTLSGVTNPQALTVTASNVTGSAGGLLTSTAVKMRVLQGDVNGDGAVNAADLTGVRNSYGKSSGQVGFDPAADLNADGAVNAADITFIRSNYGLQVP